MNNFTPNTTGDDTQASSRPAAPDKPNFSLKDIVRLWNMTTKKYGLPETRRFDDQRGNSFRKMARLEERLRKKQPWKDYFKLIGKAPALNGSNGGFKATLDWALSRRNYQRVMAGEFPVPPSEDKGRDDRRR